jgi:hypothetical protein
VPVWERVVALFARVTDVIDDTTQAIYHLAKRTTINSWLRTLAAIRSAPQTWPTRWANPEDPELAG